MNVKTWKQCLSNSITPVNPKQLEINKLEIIYHTKVHSFSVV